MLSAENNALNLDSVRLSIYSLVGFFGFMGLVALVLTFFGIMPEIVETEVHHAWEIRVSLAVTFVFSFFLIYMSAYAITVRKAIPLYIAAAVGLVAVLFLLLDIVPEAFIICIVICGIGLASLTTLWFVFVYTQSHARIFIFLSGAVACAVLICVIGEMLLDCAVQCLALALFAVSLACSAFLAVVKPGSYRPVSITNNESDKRSRILATSAIMLAVTHFEFGFIVSMADEGFFRLVCLGVAFIVCIVLFVSYALRWHAINERRLAPITTPLTVTAFTMMFLFGEAGVVASLCILAALVTIYIISGIAALAEHARLSELSLVRVFGKARLFDYVGVTLGLVAGAFASTLSETIPIDAIRFSVTLAVLYSFVAAFCHKARYPESSMVEVATTEKGAKSTWLRRCKVVSEEFGLSDRQFEVLILIAQGRNAHYIEKSLTIAESTAQTHIRNIYRKTGVHSRQELLNLIEGTKLYGEE